MDKQTMLRAAIIAALALTAIVLGWLCFGSDVPAVVEIEAPARATQTPTAVTPTPDSNTALNETGMPELNETEQTDAQGNAPAVTNRLGTLTIGRTEIPIASNVDESTLEKFPGWMPDSALPGNDGMCVILGHRNRKHLRPLEKVEIGDKIIFTYPNGQTATYTVTETIIYENTADWRLPSAVGDTLVLVTCWPFRYSGNAPGKYMVVARLF